MVNTSPRKRIAAEAGIEAKAPDGKKARPALCSVGLVDEQSDHSISTLDSAGGIAVVAGDPAKGSRDDGAEVVSQIPAQTTPVLSSTPLSTSAPEAPLVEDAPVVPLGQDITQDMRDYFEPETAERLNSMSHYTNAANNCFSLRTLDVARVAWGSSRGGRSDHCEFLCIDDTQLMVWIVTEVVAPNFFKYGKPARKAGLKFRPLLDADFEKAAHIVSTLSRPDKGDFNDTGCWASRWMGSKHVADADIKEFDRSYDALESYKAKNKMPKYAVSEIKTGDIVLIEASIIRWPIRNTPVAGGGTPPSPQKFVRPVWKKWTAEFKLECLSVVYPGSDYYKGSNQIPDEDVVF